MESVKLSVQTDHKFLTQASIFCGCVTNVKNPYQVAAYFDTPLDTPLVIGTWSPFGYQPLATPPEMRSQNVSGPDLPSHDRSLKVDRFHRFLNVLPEQNSHWIFAVLSYTGYPLWFRLVYHSTFCF